MRQQQSAILSVLLAASLQMGGCELFEKPAPMTTSISTMTFEMTDDHGNMLEHKRVLSINGLLPAPDVGMYYHYSNRRDPTTAICMSRDHSFRLVGTVEGSVTVDDVLKVRKELVELQAKTTEAVTVSNAILRYELSLAQEEGRGSSSLMNFLLNTAPSGADGQPTKLEVLRAKESELNGQIQDVSKRLQEFIKPGLIVAQWEGLATREHESAARPFYSGGTKTQSRASGFVILGGVRVSYLCIGSDYWNMLLGIPDAERHRAILAQLNLVTFVLQTKSEAYTVDSSSLNAAAAEFQANLKELATLKGAALAIAAAGELKLKMYLSNLTQLGNTGVVSGLKWERKPFCFIAGTDVNPETSTGWATLISQSAAASVFDSDLLAFANFARNASPYKSRCSVRHCEAFPEMLTPQVYLSPDAAKSMNHSDCLSPTTSGQPIGATSKAVETK